MHTTLPSNVAVTRMEPTYFNQMRELYNGSFHWLRINDPLVLSRTAIESARRILQLDRISIWRYEEQTGELVGTYGVSVEGILEPLHHLRFVPRADEQFGPIVRGDSEYVLVPDMTLHDAEGQPAGNGWHLACRLSDGDKTIGVITADNLQSKAPLSPETLELTLLYCNAISSHLARIRVEEDRRLTEMKNRTMFNSAVVGVMEWLTDGTIIDGNDRFLDMLGYTRQDIAVLRPTILDLTSPEFHETASAKFQGMLSGRTESFENESIRKDGSRLWVSITGTRFSPESNSGFCYVVDITDRIKAERERQLEAARLKLALDATECGIWEYNPQTDTLFLNEHIRKRHGLSPMAPASFNQFLSWVHPDDVGDLMVKVKEHLQTGEPFEAECRTYDVDGNIRWIQATGIIANDGRATGPISIGITFEITQQKMMEADLEQRVAERTRQLSEVNRELEEFAYTMSHDLRAPLRAIIARTALLMSGFGGEHSPETQQQLEMQQRAAHRMSLLIDNLLQFTRLLRVPIQPTDVDLSSMVADVCGAFEIHAEIEHEMVVFADRRLMRTALIFLLDNAKKFAHPDRPVVVKVGMGERGIYIQDNGVGFEMQYAAKLFKPFERLVRESDYPGTGIGLASVRRIIERHGGSIWAEGAMGQGSTFGFQLPPAPKLPA